MKTINILIISIIIFLFMGCSTTNKKIQPVVIKQTFGTDSIVPNSNIKIVGINSPFMGRITYNLNNGKNVSFNKIHQIRNFCKTLDINDSTIINLLIDSYNIQEDKMDDYFFISFNVKDGWGLPDDSEYLSAYVGVKKKKVFLRYMLKYYTKDWLFIKKYKIRTDNNKYKSKNLGLVFKRDVISANRLKESVDLYSDPSDIEMLRDIANSNSVLIRLIGDKYYKDVSIYKKHQAEIQKALKLYDLLKSIKGKPLH